MKRLNYFIQGELSTYNNKNLKKTGINYFILFFKESVLNMNLKEKVRKMVEFGQKLQFTETDMEQLYKIVNYYELLKENPEMFMGCVVKSTSQLDNLEKSSLVAESVEIANELLDDGQKEDFKQLLKGYNVEIEICSTCKSLMTGNDCIKELERVYCTNECKEKEISDLKTIVSVAYDMFNEEGVEKFLELIKVRDDEFVKNCITEQPPVNRDDLDRSDEAGRVIDLVEIANQILNDYEKEQLKDICDNQEVEVRICSVCNDLMYEGYCIEEGSAYYCSDKCRDTEMTQEEFDELYDDGDGDTYWTQWI